jgi:hypothetical protein
VLVLRKLSSSLAVVLAAAGLMAFATLGDFGDRGDPFPRSVTAPDE